MEVDIPVQWMLWVRSILNYHKDFVDDSLWPSTYQLLATHNSILSRSELELNRLQIQATLEPQLQTFSRKRNMAHMAHQLKMCLTLSCKSWLMIGHQCRWMIDVLWLFDVLVLGFQVGPKRDCNVPKPISTIKEASRSHSSLYTPRPRKGKLFIAKCVTFLRGEVFFPVFSWKVDKKNKNVESFKGTVLHSQMEDFFLQPLHIPTMAMSRCQGCKISEMLATKICFLKTGNPGNFGSLKKSSRSKECFGPCWLPRVSLQNYVTVTDRNHGATRVITQYTIYLP